MRSEDDLREAFAAKAGEAPDSAGVLRRVSLGIRPHPRRWLTPVAIGATAAAAVAIALPLSLGGGSGHQEAGRAAAPTQAAGGASSSAMALPQRQGPAGASAGDERATAALGFCRPADVTTTLTVHAGGATLTVATKSTACQLNRVPRVAWAGAGRVLDARPESSQDTNAVPGRLAAGSAAVAAIRWSGSCGAPPGDTVQIDWGAGPVPVHPTGGARCPVPAAPEDLRVGPFTGLS